MDTHLFDELDNFINNNNDKVILLYFGASWCGPCKQLKLKLSEENTIQEMPLLKVFYIDIDNNEIISSTYKIKVLPTQIFVKLSNNTVKVVARVEGYDYIKLLLEYNNYINKN